MVDLEVAYLENENFDLKRKLAAQDKNVYLDSLTGIGNRRYYDESLDLMIGKLEKSLIRNLTFAMIDVDHFKKVNDNYGHDAGDVVLKYIANAIRLGMPNDCIISRWGGEEFGLLLPYSAIKKSNSKDKAAVDILEELRLKIGKTDLRSQYGTKELPEFIQISAGLAEYRKGDEPSAIERKADNALYEAKESGRDRVFVSGEKNNKLVYIPSRELKIRPWKERASEFLKSYKTGTEELKRGINRLTSGKW